jgi:hypothetical protein
MAGESRVVRMKIGDWQGKTTTQERLKRVPFQKKPESLQLKKMIATFVNAETHGRWLHICRMEQKSTHALLREVVLEYIERKEDKARSRYAVLRTLGSR